MQKHCMQARSSLSIDQERNPPRLASRLKTPTRPPNPTPQAATEVVASPNLTPPGPKTNLRASPGSLLATEFMAKAPKDGRHHGPSCMRTQLQGLGVHRNCPGADQGGGQDGRQDLQPHGVGGQSPHQQRPDPKPAAQCATMEHGNSRGALRRLPPTHQPGRHARAGAGLHAHVLGHPAGPYLPSPAPIRVTPHVGQRSRCTLFTPTPRPQSTPMTPEPDVPRLPL
jgi:hypothetical protein